MNPTVRFGASHIVSVCLLLAAFVAAAPGEVTNPAATGERKRPNVLVIVTDDQGFGELGVTGNPVVHTPNIDRLATQSVSLTQYHVMPVCSPTRACLMTGRYNYRTGVVDTFLGRSMMDPAETTVAQMFSAGGYRTGIFGKWHLGDNYPMRAMDRGFADSLVLNGGGLAQPGDPPDPADERGAYFNATLRHNGQWIKTEGYVTDVLTNAATQFIENNRDRPFFCYLPYNCPHAPHQVPEEYRSKYSGRDLGPDAFPKIGQPMAASRDNEDIARVYGMIENIDDNIGRLLARLDQLKLSDNTILVLFSDNGCQQHNGYNAGLRGWKGTPFEGGIHQFCFVRWPSQLQAGQKVDRITSVLDWTPTLLELCGIAKPADVSFDGRSIASLLRGQAIDWPDRTLFFQWHRGDAPEHYRAFAARSQDWKLVQPAGVNPKWNGKPRFMLFNIAQDPYEEHDLAAQHPEIVAQLKSAYDRWFNDVTGKPDFSVPPRIAIGTAHENPVLLSRQDWRGPDASWGPGGRGYWEVNVTGDTIYEVTVRFDALNSDQTVLLTCGKLSMQQAAKTGDDQTTFASVRLPSGPERIEASIGRGKTVVGANYMVIKRLK